MQLCFRAESDGKYYVRYQVIGVNHVAVPTHFFKIVVMERKDNKLHMEAYVMPNQKIKDDTPLNVFMVNMHCFSSFPSVVLSSYNSSLDKT